MAPDRQRLDPDMRRKVIVDAATKLGKEGGFWAITLRDVAEACEVPTSMATVRHHFPLMDSLRIAVAEHDKGVRNTCVRFGLIEEDDK